MEQLNKSHVTFNEDEHRYFLAGGKEVKGITPIVEWVFPQTYAYIPQETLDNAAKYGSQVHKGIELIDIIGVSDEYPCNAQFLDLMRESGMNVMEHEYIVTDQKYLASPIDLVLQDKTGNIWLADIKTTYSLHESNVKCQLSVYRYLFEKQNPHLKVAGTAVVWLPKQKDKKPLFKALTPAPIKDTEKMINAYLNGDSGEQYASLFAEESTLPAQYADIVKAIADYEQTAKEIADRSKAMKAKLLEAFRENGLKSFKTDYMTITYIAPTTRTSVDNKVLKEKYPDIYNACIKTSNISDSIKITLK